ncbi:nitroreductase family protein [Lachnospiraceae bacterium KM106-2]|nr:nitroreductase family protein [Lachnospiraceae bacterium KM106-2]
MKEVESRRSIRRYQKREVSEEIILEILEAARLAPSGSNTQPWQFIIIRSEKQKERITAVDHNQRWMLSAPVFIVCVGDIRCRIKDSDGMELDETSPLPELKLVIRDMAIAAEHILLKAEQLGLGSCWTGWYEQKEMREVLGIPTDKYVVGVITIGYADENPKARPRKALSELIRYERW